jgi:hypothetical protein
VSQLPVRKETYFRANTVSHNFFIITNLIHLCIKLVIIKKLYYDARPTKYQDLQFHMFSAYI